MKGDNGTGITKGISITCITVLLFMAHSEEHYRSKLRTYSTTYENFLSTVSSIL